MSSHWLHVVRLDHLCLGLLLQGLGLVACYLKTGFSVLLDHFHLCICESFLLDLISFGLFQKDGCLFPRPALSKELLVFGLDDLARLMLHSLNFLDLLRSLHLDLSLQHVDFFHIEVMLKLEKRLHIVSLEFEDSLVFIVIDNQ